MPDLSKIKLDGTTYNLKDSIARDELEKLNIEIIQAEISCADDDQLNTGETLTLTDYNYVQLSSLAQINHKIVFLYLKIQMDRSTLYEIYLMQDRGGNIRSGEFYNLYNPTNYWSYSSGNYTSTALNQNVVLTYHEGNSLENIDIFEKRENGEIICNQLSSINASLSNAYILINNQERIRLIPAYNNTETIFSFYYFFNNTLYKIIYNTETENITEVSYNYLQDTDVFSWARQENKPTYTAAEVGALPDTTTIPTKINDLTEYKNFGIGYIDCTNINRYIFVSNVTFGSSDASDFSSCFLLMFIRKTENYGSVTIAGTGNFKFYDINSNTLNGYVTQISSATIATLKYNTLYIARLNDGELDLYPLTTRSEVNSLITSAIGNINSFEVSVVASLPDSDIDTHTIYFVSNSSSGDSIYDEYMYINNNWEKIGSTAVDLSNYLQKTDISDWAKASTKPSYTASEVGAIANTEPAASITQTNIDNWTKKSNLFTVSSSSTDNDYWWKLKIDRSNLFAFTNAPGSNGYLKYIELPVNRGNDYISLQLPTTSGKLALVSDIYSAVPDWARASTKPTYTASEIGAVPLTSSGNITITNTGKSTSTIQFINDDDNPGLIKILAEEVRINGIPTPTYNNQAVNKKYVDDSIAAITHPTNISAFNNDVGYLTSFTETDPTVPAWAKAATKPTYTASEVGAAASNHTHNEIGAYAGSGDGYVQVSSNFVEIEASTNGGGTQNILRLTGTTTTIHKVVTPTADGDAANKKYVDDAIAAITHPTNVSTFTNDAGYLTLADLPIYDGTVI